MFFKTFKISNIIKSVFEMSKLNVCVCSSMYQVVVEEDRPKKVKRELGNLECFPVPTTRQEAQAKGGVHYYTAELPPSSLPEAMPFTVGDNHTYNGYWNTPLDPRKAFLIYFQALSNFKGVSSDVPSPPVRTALIYRHTRVWCFWGF